MKNFIMIFFVMFFFSQVESFSFFGNKPAKKMINIDQLGGFNLAKALDDIANQAKKKKKWDDLPRSFFNCYKSLLNGEKEIAVDDLAEIIPLLAKWAMPEGLEEEGIQYLKIEKRNRRLDFNDEIDLKSVFKFLNIIKAKMDNLENKSEFQEKILQILGEVDDKTIADTLKFIMNTVDSTRLLLDAIITSISNIENKIERLNSICENINSKKDSI